MTIREILQNIRVDVDKLNTSFYQEFQDLELIYFVNKALQKFVKQRYSGFNLKSQGFEESQKRTDDLRSVITYQTIPQSGIGFFSNSFTYPLPTDYWFAVIEQIDITETDCNNQSVTLREGVKAIQHSNINTFIRDPFNKPKGRDVSRVIQGSNITILTDGVVTLGSLYLGYVSNNFEVTISDLDNELSLPEHTHQEIVDITVSELLETIETPRYQSYQTELNRHE